MDPIASCAVAKCPFLSGLQGASGLAFARQMAISTTGNSTIHASLDDEAEQVAQNFSLFHGKQVRLSASGFFLASAPGVAFFWHPLSPCTPCRLPAGCLPTPRFEAGFQVVRLPRCIRSPAPV
jgi:hypothetical protein